MNLRTVRFSKQEELANTISHGIGFFLAIAATVILISYSLKFGNSLSVVSNAIFGASMILLYLSSTLNHILKQGYLKDFFHNFDQIAIYFLIAGTYTPLALTVIGGSWGWLMFGIEWTFAFAGLIIKILSPNNFERGVQTFSIVSYIIMGWLLLFFIIPIINNFSTASLILIFAGGFSYTFGVIFFKLKKLPYSHLIWHIMVIISQF